MRTKRVGDTVTITFDAKEARFLNVHRVDELLSRGGDFDVEVDWAHALDRMA